MAKQGVGVAAIAITSPGAIPGVTTAPVPLLGFTTAS
jgi:hypothetical protein